MILKTAQGKYMSIFICICKGEFDALNQWPFGHKVTFSVIDQCEDPAARRNISFTVKPNVIKVGFKCCTYNICACIL